MNAWTWRAERNRRRRFIIGARGRNRRVLGPKRASRACLRTRIAEGRGKSFSRWFGNSKNYVHALVASQIKSAEVHEIAGATLPVASVR